MKQPSTLRSLVAVRVRHLRPLKAPFVVVVVVIVDALLFQVKHTNALAVLKANQRRLQNQSISQFVFMRETGGQFAS